jgi:uncharacterized protein YbaR (Trm112 family)
MLGRVAEVRTALREIVQGRREAGKHVPHPPQTGLVLEVGSGQAPHPRADVLVDKYVADDFERPQEEGIILGKPFVVADGHALPFDDGAFSYAIAIHVLEHANEPERFAAELSRVADGGFVQVPSSVSELTFGWPYHPWLIELDGGTLVFRPRDGQHAPYGDLFHRAYADSALLRNWWAANRSVFHHSVEWRGELRVRVEGKSAAEGTAEVDLERTTFVLTELWRSGALRPHSLELLDLFRCPACSGRLTFRSEAAICAGCARVYPIVGGVPVLLEEAASK